MQVRKLLNEEDAVSPVIGVILMVAITVILAAVIASFVLGLGSNTTATPTAKFTFEYDSSASDGSDTGVLSITHDGGDTIKKSEVFVRGEGFVDSATFSASSSYSGTVNMHKQGNWDGDASGDKGGQSAIVSGNSVDVAAQNDYDISVVWESSEGDSSSTLASDKGPNTS